MECCGKAMSCFSHEIHQISCEIRRISKDQLPGMVSPMFLFFFFLICQYLFFKDKCKTNHGGCDRMAECISGSNHVTCRCMIGYTGDGKNCESACLFQNGGCHPLANCTINEVKTETLCSCHQASWISDYLS